MQIRKLLWLIPVLVAIIALGVFFEILATKRSRILPDTDPEGIKSPVLLGLINSYADNRSFIRPASIAVAPNGHIYVVDSQANKVIIYDRYGRYVDSFGKLGNKHGELAYPLGIAIDRDGKVYISEVVNHRIQVFSADGKFLNAFPKNPNSLKAPTAIAVDRANRIYVFDKQDHRIKVYDASGQILLTFGGRGSDPGKLNYAMGLVVSGKGDVYVSDSGNSRIQVFNSQGRFLREIQGQKQVLSNPRGIALDEKENLFVADSLVNDVIAIDKQGSNFSFKSFQGLDGFYFPDGLAYQNHRLFVVDKGNKRVVVFQLPR